MQAGTTAAYPYPLRRQVLVSTSRDLSAQELNSLIVVDSSAGPVVLTLPPAASIQGGGFFQILALNGNVNPVTVSLQPGDTYNDGLVAPLVLNSAGEQSVVLGRPPDVGNSWLIPQGIAAPVGAGSFDVEFGVRDQAGVGGSPRFLWPGAGRTVTQTNIVARPLAANGILRAIVVRQNNPLGAGAQTTVYSVLVNGAVVASTPAVAVTSSGIIVAGLNVPASQGDAIAFQAVRSANHATLFDVLASTLWESA